jgi:hypothetical protein
MIPIRGGHLVPRTVGQCGQREYCGDDVAAMSADIVRRTLSQTIESLRIER